MNVQLPPIVEPFSRRWTKDEFYRLGECGFFAGQRAELIEGEIMVQSPQKAEHFTAIKRVARILESHFGTGFDVRAQGPLALGQHTEPEPDVAIVTGQSEDYQKAHPQSALLVVEVSETTLVYDQTDKASLYAAAGIADYWIVNLVADQLEVYRCPAPDPDQPYGARYSSVTVYSRGATVSPLAKPGTPVAVTDLLG